MLGDLTDADRSETSHYLRWKMLLQRIQKRSRVGIDYVQHLIEMYVIDTWAIFFKVAEKTDFKNFELGVNLYWCDRVHQVEREQREIRETWGMTLKRGNGPYGY